MRTRIMGTKVMGTTVTERLSRRELPLEALQILAELGVGLDDIAALRRVSRGLEGGVPKCCIAFALFYGRVVDAGRQDLVAGYRTWMNSSRIGPHDYVLCPRCLLEKSSVRAVPSDRADER